MFEIQDISLNFCDAAHLEKSAAVSEKVIDERAMKLVVKNDERNFMLAKKLGDLCVLPKFGEQWRIITEKSFNAYNFILNILQNGDIDELYLAIYRINEPTVFSIIELLEKGRIKKAAFIVSSFFNQTKKPEKWAITLCNYCKNNQRTKFAYLHNHAKICCAKQGGDYYVFEGSGNMSDNARIEQYVYENSQAVFDFHKNWMEELISKTK